MKSPVVSTFFVETLVSVGGGDLAKVLRDMNIAWGFQDGKCNEYVDGVMVAKSHPNMEQLQEAAYKLHQTSCVTLRVDVLKDGSKEVKVMNHNRDLVVLCEKLRSLKDKLREKESKYSLLSMQLLTGSVLSSECELKENELSRLDEDITDLRNEVDYTIDAITESVLGVK